MKHSLKRSIMTAAAIVSFPLVAMAQQQNPNAVNQLMNSLNSPEAQRALQQVMQNQEIDMTQYEAWHNHNCDEDKLRQCEAGYRCEGGDGKGNGSTATIQGRKNDRCHVSMTNTDGSTGDCFYSDETIEHMLKLYRQPKVKVAEALTLGQRVISECKFTDKNGNPVSADQMRPAGTKAKEGAVQ